MSNNKITTWGPVKTFMKVGSCSETLVNVLNRAYDHPLPMEEQSSASMAGGIMQQGYQCGMLWGASLAAGVHANKLFGTGHKSEAMAISVSEKLVEKFYETNNSINCIDVAGGKMQTKMEIFLHFLRGGPIKCFRLSSTYSKEAFDIFEESFANDQIEVPDKQISCASLMAKKLGASDAHAVMVSGFAGGLGLSGGGCGALGVAIWILGMKFLEENKIEKFLWESKEFKSGVDDLIEAFLKNSDYQYECSEIVGKKFSSINEHSNHICSGGCSKIIEALANA